MKILVAGGTGATGRHFVNALLSKGCDVTIIVRNSDKISSYFSDRKRLTVVTGTVLDMDYPALQELVRDVDAIGSCLGHPITFKGTFGEPKKLVVESIQRLCRSVGANAQDRTVRLVLMSTTGVRNKNIQEKRSVAERILFHLISSFVPQQRDNEQVVEYLRSGIGIHNERVEWVIVRPDRLTNEQEVSQYKVFDTAIRSPLFNGGTTSRINVGNFMAEIVADDDKWNQWKGKMPVIYNAPSSGIARS